MAESCLFFVGNFPTTTTKKLPNLLPKIERKKEDRKKNKEKEIFFAEEKKTLLTSTCVLLLYKLLCVTYTHQPPWRELQTRKPDIIHNSGNDRKSNSLTLTEIIILCYYFV